MTAVAQSGFSIMSDSLIAFQPAMEEPSNMMPSVRKSSLMVAICWARCCHLPRGSVKRKSTYFDFLLLDQVENLLRVGHSCFLGYVQG